MSNILINNKNNDEKKIKFIEQFLICPKCNLNIPSLPFFVNSIEIGSIEILINCKCGNKDRMPLEDCFNYKIPAQKSDICEECNSNKPQINCLFCINCSKWICEDCRYNFYETEKKHYYSKYPIVFSELCDIHINNEKLFYCKTCKNEFCIKCKKYHPEKHNIIYLIEYYLKSKQLSISIDFENSIKLVFKKNEELMKTGLYMLEKIEEEHVNNLNNDNINEFKDINKEKENFIELYNKNLKSNQQFNKFVHILYDIFTAANAHPNFNIIHNFELSSYINKDNFPEIEIENKNNIKNHYINQYTKILKYFKENYLLSIKSLISINEQKNYLEYINVKLLLKINEESFVFTSDNFFQKFNIKTKEISDQIKEHTKEITKLILLKSGKLVTSSKDTNIKIWNLESNITLSESLNDHDAEVVELVELSNGNLLSGDINGKLIIWDVINRYRQIQSFSLNSIIIGVFEIKANEYIIAFDKCFVIYQNNKKSIVKNFDNKKINCILFIKNTVICGTNDNFINVYEQKSFNNIKNILVNTNIVLIKEFTNKYFYGISSEYTLHFFNSINFEQLFCINVKTYNFYEFLVMNDSSIYTGSNNGLTEWNANFTSIIDDLVEYIVLV